MFAIFLFQSNICNEISDDMSRDWTEELQTASNATIVTGNFRYDSSAYIWIRHLL